MKREFVVNGMRVGTRIEQSCYNRMLLNVSFMWPTWELLSGGASSGASTDVYGFAGLLVP